MFAGEGASNESGVLKMVIFASFARCIFRVLTSKAAFIILCYVARYWLFNDTKIDDLEWPFCVKICFGLGNGWVGVSGFRTKLFENLQSYPYTVSDKNVAQGT